MSAPALRPLPSAAPSASAGEAGFSISVLESDSALDAIEGAWRSLLRPRQFFVGPEWTRSWLKSRARGAAPFVLVARDSAGEVVGLLPLARAGRGVVPCGASDGAAHVDVVAAPGRERAVAEGVVSALRGMRDARVRLLRLARDGALYAAAVEDDGTAPASVASTATTCPYVSVERGWDAFLRGLKRHARHEARRRLARLAEHSGARVRWVTEPSECAPAIRTLFDLHRRRFEQLGKPSAFSGAALEAFHVELAQAAARSGRLLLGILEEDGVPVAADYGFLDAEVAMLFQTGLDPAAGLASVAGEALRAILLRDRVAGTGRRELDLLDGCADWKSRWAGGVRTLHDVEVFPAGLRGSARRAASAATLALRCRASRLLHGPRCPGREDPTVCGLPGCPVSACTGQESSEVHSS